MRRVGRKMNVIDFVILVVLNRLISHAGSTFFARVAVLFGVFRAGGGCPDVESGHSRAAMQAYRAAVRVLRGLNSAERARMFGLLFAES